MDVVDSLATMLAVVHNKTEAAFLYTELCRDLVCCHDELPEKSFVLRFCCRDTRDAPLRDDENVDRRLRADVVEGKHIVVLVHLVAWDFPADDLPEDRAALLSCLWGRQ